MGRKRKVSEKFSYLPITYSHYMNIFVLFMLSFVYEVIVEKILFRFGYNNIVLLHINN